MTQALEIPYGAFFNADAKPAAFAGLLESCIRSRGAMHVRIMPGSVVIEAADAAQRDGALRLGGQWRSPDFNSVRVEVASSRLFIPLLMNISEIYLHHSQFYTLGHGHRSISDFVCRNIFMYLERNRPELYVPEGHLPDANSTRGLRDLQIHYFFIVKSLFADPLFEGRTALDMIDLIVANAYVPALTFASPLLQKGAEALRANIIGPETESGEKAKSELRAVRRRVLAHFKN